MGKKLSQEEKDANKLKREEAKAEKEKNKVVDKNADPADTRTTENTEKVSLAQAQAEEKGEEPVKEKKVPKTILEKGYPGEGTKTGLVWTTLDGVLSTNLAASRKELLAACEAAGVNKATCQTQYAAWRKYHQEAGNWEGVEAARTAAKTEKEAAETQAKVDAKAAKKAEKETEAAA